MFTRKEKTGVLLIILSVVLFGTFIWFGYIQPRSEQVIVISQFVTEVEVVATPLFMATATPTSTPMPTPMPTALPAPEAEITPHAVVVSKPTSTPLPTVTPLPTATVEPKMGDFLLEIPVINLSWVVHELENPDESDPWLINYTELDEFGVIRMPEMAYPGQEGVVGIAGHRDISGAPFLNLHRISIGDEILIIIKGGDVYRYVVTSARHEVPANEVSVFNFIDNGTSHQLRLITCGFWDSSVRIVIYAEQIGE